MTTSPQPKAQPVIGFFSDRIEYLKHPAHMVWQTYIEPVCQRIGGIPVIIPSGTGVDLTAYLALVDGLVFPGSPSNVEPHLYNGPQSAEGTLHDPLRDATTLPMIRLAIERRVPMLSICRGFQELNVALGGSLHQNVCILEDALDHAAGARDMTKPHHEWYQSMHDVELNRDGVLFSLLQKDTVQVNSLHTQGIQTLSPALSVEAVAPDGLVEAVSLKDRQSYVMAVQWHPESDFASNEVSHAIFDSFGQACMEHARSRQRV